MPLKESSTFLWEDHGLVPSSIPYLHCFTSLNLPSTSWNQYRYLQECLDGNDTDKSWAPFQPIFSANKLCCRQSFTSTPSSEQWRIFSLTSYEAQMQTSLLDFLRGDLAFPSPSDHSYCLYLRKGLSCTHHKSTLRQIAWFRYPSPCTAINFVILLPKKIWPKSACQICQLPTSYWWLKDSVAKCSKCQDRASLCDSLVLKFLAS